MDALFARMLQANASAMGISLSAVQLEQCIRYAALVVEWNERMNLTSLVSPEDMAIKHFIDSFTCLGVGTWPVGGKAVDVGTGAGFPGIPLAIMRPDLRWVLADALNKRIEFLKVVVRELGLEHVECVHARAEEIGRQKELREQCDVVVARAVARLPVLLEYCLPLVRLQGGFLAMKGREAATEMAEAQSAARILGAAEPLVTELELPQEAGTRTLVWYTKIKKTPKTYPRRAGLPAKAPLQ
ncbi:MAG: 16S rRNA (guanine(527)-N(7))-methyltransferase RsmG [Limnochordia bacterium]|jgi:16S rRNA (guanine527-N7)-methyltransferase